MHLGTASRSYEWILLVEDDSDACSAYASTLKDAGFRVVEAHSVPEANSKLQKQKFRGVVLDLHLASRSGEQVLDYLRQSPGMNVETPVLIVSGYLDPAAIQKLKPRVQGMLVKPFNTAELIDRIKTAINTPVVASKAAKK